MLTQLSCNYFKKRYCQDDFISLSIRVYEHFNSIKWHNGGDLSQAYVLFSKENNTH